MFDRMHQRLRESAWIFYAVILVQMPISAYFQLYLLKDNQWAPDPASLNVRWVSDPVTADGRPSPSTPDPVDYQLATPDGRWHGQLRTKSSPFHDFQTWMSLATPVFSTALVGLYASYPRRQKPAPTKQEREEVAAA
jgi:hypothetical protein